MEHEDKVEITSVIYAFKNIQYTEEGNIFECLKIGFHNGSTKISTRDMELTFQI